MIRHNRQLFRFFGSLIFLSALLALLPDIILARSEYFVRREPLRGSAESLRRQNTIADQYDLSRIEDIRMLEQFVNEGILVSVPQEGKGFVVTAEERFRYARPWAKAFIEYLGEGFYDTFHQTFSITSLVRTESYQRLLVTTGFSDANGTTPERRSLHLTGTAFDISKKNFGREKIKWMRVILTDWKRCGVIEAVDEIYNNAFHVVVFPTYDRNAERKNCFGASKKKKRKKS